MPLTTAQNNCTMDTIDTALTTLLSGIPVGSLRAQNVVQIGSTQYVVVVTYG